MSDGIVIPITAGVDQFSAAIKSGVISPLDSVQEAMDKITAASNQGGGDGLADSMKDAQEATNSESEALSKIKTNLSEIQSASHTTAIAAKSDAEETSQAFEVSGTEQKRISKEVTHEVGENSKDMASNFAMGAAGMSGSLGDIATTAQTALQQVAFLGGPEIALPAAAAAVAVGLISSALNNDKESAAALAKAISDLTGQFDTMGIKGADGASQIDKNLDKLAQSGDLGKIAEGASAAGISFTGLARAIAGNNVPAMKSYKTQIDAAIESQTKQAASIYNSTGAQSGAYNADVKRINALNDLKDKLTDGIDATDGATKANKLYKQAEDDVSTASQTAAQKIKAAADAAGQTVGQYKTAEAATSTFSSSLHSSLESAGEDTSDFTKNGIVNLDDYTKNLNATTQSVLQESANLTSVAPHLTTAGLNYVKSLGSSAAPLLAEAVKLNPSSPQYQALVQSWDDAGAVSGKKLGSSATSATQEAINKAKPAKVSVTADMSSAETSLKNFLNKPRTLTVNVKTTGANLP